MSGPFPERVPGDVHGRVAAGTHGLQLVLVHPEIAPNTGTIARLCVGTDTVLHLVHPLGFRTDDASLKRAGLDYWRHLRVREYASLDVFLDAHPWALARGWFTSGLPAYARPYTSAPFRRGDYLFLGRESSGLPPERLAEQAPRVLHIPMCGPVRGLNVSIAAGIVLYAALARTQPDLFEVLPPA